ncbi:MAG: hypothetical protein ACYTGL_22150, partial [Planctomycetota bacterium]
TTACAKEESTGNTGSPCGADACPQPELREEQAGPERVANGFVVVLTPGPFQNFMRAGRAKERRGKAAAEQSDDSVSATLPTCRVPGKARGDCRKLRRRTQV